MSYDNPSVISRFLSNPLAMLVAGLAALVLLISTVSIVPETKQGVVVRLSKIDRDRKSVV